MLPGREVGRWLFEVFVVLLSLHLSCASSDSKCLLGLDGHRYTGCNSHSRRSRQRNSLPVHSLYLSLSYNYYVCVCVCVSVILHIAPFPNCSSRATHYRLLSSTFGISSSQIKARGSVAMHMSIMPDLKLYRLWQLRSTANVFITKK